MTFEEFKQITKDGIANGEISSSVNLGELGLAIQYVVGKEMEIKGKPLTLTSKQIVLLIRKHCGVEVYKRVFLKDKQVDA